MASPFALLAALLLAFLGVALVVGLVWLAVVSLRAVGTGVGAASRGVGQLFGHLGGTLTAWVRDLLRLTGALIAAALLPLAMLWHVALGRWSAVAHFGRAARDELMAAAASLYRVTVAHPLRLVGMGSVLEGVEQRMPEVVASAPGPDRPSPKRDFPGYEVIGSLPSGGSGARLWLAKPGADKAKALAEQFGAAPERVVIKAFDLLSGSTLPQIVRENRALEAARKLGLVLEHVMAADRFHYVMPYAPGDDLSEVARRLHARAGTEGLSDAALRGVIGYASGLLEILERFHVAGLWHKDIKPSNVIVHGERVQLVDLGLVTPLASAMTLTTHGTEYYRDPELVRLAMKGVKVHEVDGVKFDLYSVGALIYFLVEHSFPANGNLSRLTKRCPDGLQWVIRRGMASIDNRYANARAMRLDLEALLAAPDLFRLKPAALPSMGGKAPELEQRLAGEWPDAADDFETRFAGFGGASAGGGAAGGAAGGFEQRAERFVERAERFAEKVMADVESSLEEELEGVFDSQGRRRRAGKKRPEVIVTPGGRGPSGWVIGCCWLPVLGFAALVVLVLFATPHRFEPSAPRPLEYSIQTGPLPPGPVAGAPGDRIVVRSGSMGRNQIEIRRADGSVQAGVARPAPALPAPPPPGPPPAPDLPAGTRLILLEAGPVPPDAARLAELARRLGDHMGVPILAESSLGELGPEELNRLAEARTLVGLTGTDDEEAAQRLIAWVENAELPTAVLWVGLDERGQSLRFRLMAPDALGERIAPAVSYTLTGPPR